MKTIILYASKYGAAKAIADKISALIPGSVMRDLATGRPGVGGYDCVILGGSVYAGMLRKQAKEYARIHEAALAGKKLGLFISGMSENDSYFKSNFPPELLKNAASTAFLGGVFDPKKASGLDKLIYKLATKQKDYANTIDDGKIAEFAAKLMA